MDKENLVVIGGGITGLLTAYIAAKEGKKVTVLEKSNKTGGLLKTFEVGGNLLEFYYHHFFTHDKEINWLIDELNLSDKVIFQKTEMGTFKNGKIYKFNSPKDLIFFKPLNWFGKFMFGVTALFLGKVAKWEKYENTPALDWFYKRAGKNVTNAIWKPLLDIKFGPYAKEIPLAWMVGRMRQRMNSRKKGEEHLGYLDGSLHVLLQALLDKLKSHGTEIITGADIKSLDIQNNKIYGVKTTHKYYSADKVVLTIPSPAVAELVKPHHSAVAEKIGKVDYFGAICTVLELSKPLSSIYWMNIADENYPFGGIIEHTNFIAPEKYDGKHIVYLSRYFALSEEIAKMETTEIKKMMLSGLKKVYPNLTEEQIEKVHVFKTQTAATVCDLNFSEKITPAKLPIENLFFANMAHVYPDERSVNNSIRIAAEACKAMGINSGFVPYGNSMSGKIGF